MLGHVLHRCVHPTSHIQFVKEFKSNKLFKPKLKGGGVIWVICWAQSLLFGLTIRSRKRVVIFYLIQFYSRSLCYNHKCLEVLYRNLESDPQHATLTRLLQRNQWGVAEWKWHHTGSVWVRYTAGFLFLKWKILIWQQVRSLFPDGCFSGVACVVEGVSGWDASLQSGTTGFHAQITLASILLLPLYYLLRCVQGPIDPKHSKTKIFSRVWTITPRLQTSCSPRFL